MRWMSRDRAIRRDVRAAETWLEGHRLHLRADPRGRRRDPWLRDRRARRDAGDRPRDRAGARPCGPARMPSAAADGSDPAANGIDAFVASLDLPTFRTILEPEVSRVRGSRAADRDDRAGDHRPTGRRGSPGEAGRWSAALAAGSPRVRGDGADRRRDDDRDGSSARPGGCGGDHRIAARPRGAESARMPCRAPATTA